MAMDYFRPFAKVIKESNYDPGVVNGALSVVGLQAGPEEADNLRKSFAADPKSVAMMVESMLVTTKKDLMNVSEGAAIFDPNTGQQVFENVKPDPTQNLDQMLAAALKAGDRAKVNEIIKLKGQEAAATRAPQQGAQPNYREINTVDEAGNPILKFMTPEQVNAMGGVKTSPKTTAKATGPAAVDAVLGEIEDLSKRINTVASGPGANIQGMVRRGASALNMDNEVSEYQRLVEGFIPIMARSVGHTGVLTQMDVDSTKALFPKVGDNSTLSTNLIARVKRIMSALQDPSVAALGPDASFSAKMAAAQAIANKGGGKSPTTPDPLGIRK